MRRSGLKSALYLAGGFFVGGFAVPDKEGADEGERNARVDSCEQIAIDNNAFLS